MIIPFPESVPPVTTPSPVLQSAEELNKIVEESQAQAQAGQQDQQPSATTPPTPGSEQKQDQQQVRIKFQVLEQFDF